MTSIEKTILIVVPLTHFLLQNTRRFKHMAEKRYAGVMQAYSFGVSKSLIIKPNQKR